MNPTNSHINPQSQNMAATDATPGNLSNHVIVCGFETLGFRVAEQLRAAGLQVVILDEHLDPNLIEPARRLQIVVVEGNARDATTLLGVGLKEAIALVACGKNDLYNLQIILSARRLSHHARIVTNFSDAKLGLELDQAVPNLKVLSLPQMAAPSFTEACLASSVIDFFNIGEHKLVVVHARTTRPISLAELSASSLPLFLEEAPLANPVTPPPEKLPTTTRHTLQENQDIRPGWDLTLAGRIEDLLRYPGLEINEKEVLRTLSRHTSSPDKKELAKSRSASSRLVPQLRAVLQELGNELKGPFRYALLVVGLIILFSTILLWQFYRTSFTTPEGRPVNFSLLDSLYFTITVITSVGFGDYNFAQQNWELKIFGIFLILVGVAATSVLYAFVANFIISRRLAQTLGREQATELRGHVVVCGLGALGYEVMEGLYKQGQPVVVVDKNEQGSLNQQTRRLGIPLIYGDISQPQTLRAANVGHARAIALLTGDDLANLKAALSARAEYVSSGEKDRSRLQVVLRLFDYALAEQVAETFDIQISYSASALAAPYFVGAALDYETVSTFYYKRKLFIVGRLELKPSGKFSGQTVKEFFELTGMQIIAYTAEGSSNRVELYPSSQTELAGGASVYVIGSPTQMLKIYELNDFS